MRHYAGGTSREGPDIYPIEFEDHSIRAYPSLLLFKCLKLQKWFRSSTIFWTYEINIHSDSELENQINDRLSFKKAKSKL